MVLHRQEGYSKTLTTLNQLAKMNFPEFFGSAALMEAADEFDRAALDPEGLLAHATLRDVLNEVEPHGVMALVQHRMQAGRSLEGLAEQCEALAVRQLAKSVFAGPGRNLTKFRGAKLDEFRCELAGT
jgi:predicted methyltransferase